MIEWALKDRGLDVTTVQQPKDAINALRTKHFDVVLTDVDEDQEAGILVMHEAKIIDPETIVILLGCHEPETFDMDKLPADADDVIFKPCGAPKLWSRLSRCLERMELRRRDAHCRNGRRNLLQLAAEIKQLRDGNFGDLNDTVTEKISEMLGSVEDMIANSERHLSANNS
jgi:DNA-binding NtrC family response regulator